MKVFWGGIRPFAKQHNFTTTTRVVQGTAFSCKKGPLYLNLTEITKFKYEKNSEKDSGCSNTMYNEAIAQLAVILLIYC